MAREIDPVWNQRPALDDGHIVRFYWDVDRYRRPRMEDVAVVTTQLANKSRARPGPCTIWESYNCNGGGGRRGGGGEINKRKQAGQVSNCEQLRWQLANDGAQRRSRYVSAKKVVKCYRSTQRLEERREELAEGEEGTGHGKIYEDALKK